MKLLKTMMAVAAFALASGTVQAFLDKSYAQSCEINGGPGRLFEGSKSIYWHVGGDHTVIEAFVEDRCVAVRMIPDKGRAYDVEIVTKMLPYVCLTTHSWIQLPDSPDTVANWATTDGLILGALYPSGICQFAYKSWLEENGLLGTPLPRTTPSENDIAPMK
jgi:hypothetical protein